MKQIYRYKKAIDNFGVSNINRTVKTGDGYITIHHELKNGIPQLYWFSTFIAKRFMANKDEEQYISFDIRDIWRSYPEKKPGKWHNMTDRKRLTEVTRIIEELSYKSPEKFIQQCRKWEIDIPF